MGDMAKKKGTRLSEKIAEKEKLREETIQIENTTIDELVQRPNTKDKAISVRLNATNYMKFKTICKQRGFSVNAAINMLVSDFIKDNREFLD